jgi:hypothetical protein
MVLKKRFLSIIAPPFQNPRSATVCDSIRSEPYCLLCFSMNRCCWLRLYLTSRSDRNQSDLCWRNPFRNPLVRNPVKFGWVPTGFYWEFADFRSKPTSSPTISHRIHRSDWTTWDNMSI